jgi:hypothetical protein
MTLRLEKASGRSPLHDVKDKCELIGELAKIVLFAANADGLRHLAGAPGSSAKCASHEAPQDCSDVGGARRDRTDDLLLAKQALSQLSYGPAGRSPPKARSQKPEIGSSISDL